MTEKIYIDMLNEKTVSIRKQKYTTIDGVEYAIGNPDQEVYVNSVSGRDLVTANVADPFKTAIFAVWGDTPLV